MHSTRSNVPDCFPLSFSKSTSTSTAVHVVQWAGGSRVQSPVASSLTDITSADGIDRQRTVSGYWIITRLSLPGPVIARQTPHFESQAKSESQKADGTGFPRFLRSDCVLLYCDSLGICIQAMLRAQVNNFQREARAGYFTSTLV